MIDSVHVLLFAFLLIAAVGVLRLHNLFAAVMAMGVFSLLSAVLFTVMDAPDVAFTEAAVGAGISTILFLGTLAVVPVREADERNRRSILAAVVVGFTGGALLYGTLDFPHYGDASAPVHQHVAQRFLQIPPETHVPNMVTAVLASYRGYDTWGEVTVVFTAAVGVILLLGAWRSSGAAAASAPVQAREYLVLRVLVKGFVPYLLLFGLYVQFHGDFSPGGGFQAGVIVAAGIILHALVFGRGESLRLFTMRRLELAMAGGVLLYGGVGVATMLRGGEFLDYDYLGPHAHAGEVDAHGQHLGILLVELGVGLTVAAVMLALFFQFFERESTPRAGAAS